MTNEKTTESKRGPISKRKLANTAVEMEDAAVVAATDRTLEAVHGAERLKAAGEIADAGSVLLAKGASDITQAGG